MTPALTTNPDNIAAKVKAAYPRAETMGHGVAGLAAIANLSIEEVHAHIETPGALAELAATKVRAESDGSLLECCRRPKIDPLLEVVPTQN